MVPSAEASTGTAVDTPERVVPHAVAVEIDQLGNTMPAGVGTDLARWYDWGDWGDWRN